MLCAMPGKETQQVRLFALGDARIETSQGVIEPTAKVAFAAALYLILERKDPVSRRGLERLLWPGVAPSVASHRLRQTLLKLKRLGVPVEAVGKARIGLGISAVSIDFSEYLSSSEVDPGVGIALLSGYEPDFSVVFADWLDKKRAQINGLLATYLLHRMAHERANGRWDVVEATAALLLSVAPLNEEATLAMAEALAMRGAKVDAVARLETYLDELGLSRTDLRLQATLMRKRVSERTPAEAMHPGRVEAPLVGRATVIATLGEMLGKVRQSHAQSFLLWGDAGIGKSRVLSELTHFASLQGVITARVQCRPSGPYRPLSAFIDLVPMLQVMRGAIGCSPETIRYLDRLTKHLPEAVDTRDSAEGESSFVFSRIRRALFDLVDAIADENPIIVLIEDVHWIDTASMVLLREIVDWAGDRSLLFACTGRSQLEVASDQMSSIELGPLDAASAAAVIADAARGHGRIMSPAYLEWCLNVAEGNPYFLLELTKHWIETGAEHEAPRSLTAALDQRVQRLDSDSLQVLQSCAILEKNASMDRVERLLEHPPHRLLNSINALDNAGMLARTMEFGSQVGSSLIATRHDLLSDSALRTLSPPGAAFLHRRAGLVLESEVESSPSASILWECANHWQLAGDSERAFSLAYSCATHLMKVGLPSAAAEAFEKSLRFCTSEQQQLRVLEGQTRAYYGCGAWHSLSETAGKAHSLKYRLYPDVDQHDEVELMDLRAQWRHRGLDAVLRHALECLNASTASANHRIRAGIMALMLTDLVCDHTAMRATYLTLKPLLDESGTEESHRLEAAMVFHTVCGDFAAAVAATRDLVKLRRQLDNLADYMRALTNGAVAFRTAGLFSEAYALLHEALTIANSHKLPLAAATPLLLLANMDIELNERSAAVAWYEQLASIPAIPGDNNDRLARSAVGARIALFQGDFATARSLVGEDVNLLLQDPMPHRRTYSLALAIAVDLAEGIHPHKQAMAGLEASHLQSRRNARQAFSAYVLHQALVLSGRQAKAKRLLGDYVSEYRREPTPAPHHILALLETFPSRLARQ